MTAIYNPGDIADLLQIKESTLRKYALMLEKLGYRFQKNSQNQRWYTEKDIALFKKIIALKNSGDMDLKSSIEAAFLWSKGELVAEDKPVAQNAITLQGEGYSADIARIEISIEELKDVVLQQNEKIEQLTKIVLEQQNYINNEFEQLKSSQLERVEIAATMGEEKEDLDLKAPQSRRKGFFARLFNK
ncbi:MAG: MerR family transcriptional regulator [Enterococcus sp.]|nr:MerR family transcriptional regulator [Enterococcus sp.]